MTSVLRIRRRHRLPEGNLGLSKPSCDEKAGAGNFLLLGESVTASAQNVAPVVTTPIAPFTVFAGAPARSIDSHHGVFQSGRVECGAAGRVTSLKHPHLHYRLDGQRKPVTVGNFLNYVNFEPYFATDATSGKAADLSAWSVQRNPPSWSPSQWGITLPLSGELGQCLPGSPYSRSIRNRIITL